MDEDKATAKTGWRALPRNVWAVSLTSFFMDISSEMVINILPLFLVTLGVSKEIIGAIEGLADTVASVLQVFSGWLSDLLSGRKWLAVIGYAVSAVSKPFFYLANGAGAVAGARWADRVGKGIRTSPRDALVADSIGPKQRGLAFGVHRGADTAGAMLGLMIALGLVWALQRADLALERRTFQMIVLVSLVPALLSVLSLALGARDVPVTSSRRRPLLTFGGLGRPFMIFTLIVALFTLGNSSDAFLVLRAQERGLNVLGILGMLITFNLMYSLLSAPAGQVSDRVGRRKIIVGGWLVYAAIYAGFALARNGWQTWVLYSLYGVYYGLAYGVAKAMVADLVPADLRGTAYGTYNTVVGLLAFPSSFIAGMLWQYVTPWAPFAFGAALALSAAVLMILWKPPVRED
jgi:MFS family permease